MVRRLQRRTRDLDVTEGNYVTWNWGVSRIAALGETPVNLLDVGATGYSQWQTSDTTGADAPCCTSSRPRIGCRAPHTA